MEAETPPNGGFRPSPLDSGGGASGTAEAPDVESRATIVPSSARSLAEWSTIAATFGTSWALLSSVLYLIGYWTTFGVNIFEFVGIGDVLATSVVPISAGLFGLVFGLTIWGLALALPGPSGPFRRTSRVPPSKPESEAPPRRSTPIQLKTKLWFLGALMAIAYGVLLWSEGGWYYLTYEVAVLMALGCAYAIARVGVVAPLIQDGLIRFCVVMIVLVVPFLSFAHGKVRSIELHLGDATYLYACEADLKIPDAPDLAFGTELRFVGKAGDFFFFERPFAHVRILKFDDFRLFRLKERRNSDHVRPCQA